MRHAKPYRKLSRQRHHYRAMMRNMAFSLFEHERIQTTLIKAKESRRLIEKLITLGKRGGLHNRRRAMALLGNKVIHNKQTGERVDIVGKLFDELAERYKNRSGGYTRIYRLARERAGDAAPMAILELVDAPESKLFKTEGDSESEGTKKKASKKKAKSDDEEAPAEERAAS